MGWVKAMVTSRAESYTIRPTAESGSWAGFMACQVLLHTSRVHVDLDLVFHTTTRPDWVSIAAGLSGSSLTKSLLTGGRCWLAGPGRFGVAPFGHFAT